jgi:hypothetical protein
VIFAEGFGEKQIQATSQSSAEIARKKLECRASGLWHERTILAVDASEPFSLS